VLQTFRNAWRIEELRKKILFTLLIVLLYRLGNAVPVPFVDTKALADYFQASGLQNTILGLFNVMDRAVAGDAGDLLLAFLAAFLLQTLQRGDRNAQELNDDGSVDVRLDGQCEDRRLRERAAGHVLYDDAQLQPHQRGLCQQCLGSHRHHPDLYVRLRPHHVAW